MKVVVCVGNIYRSPRCEALLRHRMPALDVRSAGLGALVRNSKRLWSGR